jgi:diguanylate cyclase (GGDEF)-like protein
MDSAYRYGGEEFTVILPETVGAEAETVAQRLRITVENENFAPETIQVVPITISVGVTEYNPKEDIATFIQRADQAMYMSKQEGRNKVTCLFVEETV